MFNFNQREIGIVENARIIINNNKKERKIQTKVTHYKIYSCKKWNLILKNSLYEIIIKFCYKKKEANQAFK